MRHRHEAVQGFGFLSVATFGDKAMTTGLSGKTCSVRDCVLIIVGRYKLEINTYFKTTLLNRIHDIDGKDIHYFWRCTGMSLTRELA
jgi:hypothetical protein